MRKTISIKLDMEPQDYAHFVKMAYSHNRTPEEILIGFISDLVCGVDTNGSDERDMASDYFERCQCNHSYPDDHTLCAHLIESGDMDTFLYALESSSWADAHGFEEEAKEWDSSIYAMYEDYVDYCKKHGYRAESYTDAIISVTKYSRDIM